MPMLKWNAGKVKNLAGAEIWLFIVGRVLVTFGVGAILARYDSQIVKPLALPAMVAGLLLFPLAAKGMFRRPRPN